MLTQSDSSMPAAALGGYSPPTPNPAIPRTTTKYHSILLEGCTCRASAAIKVPIATREDVKSNPARRENISEVYPKTTTPRIAPTMTELLMRVFISEENSSAPSTCLKITFVGLARVFWKPSLKLAMYWGELVGEAQVCQYQTHTTDYGDITLPSAWTV